MVGIPSSRPRRHQGDIMSAEKRSAVMARIKGKDTGPEKQMAAALAEHGLSWESHARDLPGRPDFVFRDQRIAIFVDGDFWHGWRFPQWRNKLSEKWEAKKPRSTATAAVMPGTTAACAKWDGRSSACGSIRWQRTSTPV